MKVRFTAWSLHGARDYTDDEMCLCPSYKIPVFYEIESYFSAFNITAPHVNNEATEQEDARRQ